MAETALDHLVVAAASLEQGLAWCESTLGVTPGPGGEHPLFGTHNRLLKLHAEPGERERFAEAYLEIIAINPAAPAPGRPRWFGLDEPALQQRLQAQGPQLLHAVLRSNNIEMHRWGLITLGHAVGDIVEASRMSAHGPLQWRITLRPDGALLCAGALPTLIQWRGPHPTQHMADSGLRLRSLCLRGLPPRTRQLLRVPNVRLDEAAPGQPALSAVLHTPRGDVSLNSAP
jgi:hypothetical protein